MIKKQLIEVLKMMKNDLSIKEQVFQRIKPTGPIIAQLCGLPKIHKPDLPLQPILDISRSPYHSIEEQLADLLEPGFVYTPYMTLLDSLTT